MPHKAGPHGKTPRSASSRRSDRKCGQEPLPRFLWEGAGKAGWAGFRLASANSFGRLSGRSQLDLSRPIPGPAAVRTGASCPLWDQGCGWAVGAELVSLQVKGVLPASLEPSLGTGELWEGPQMSKTCSDRQTAAGYADHQERAWRPFPEPSFCARHCARAYLSCTASWHKLLRWCCCSQVR